MSGSRAHVPVACVVMISETMPELETLALCVSPMARKQCTGRSGRGFGGLWVVLVCWAVLKREGYNDLRSLVTLAPITTVNFTDSV